MRHLLTLIADRTAATLTPQLIAHVRDAVGGGAAIILSPGEAADIPLTTAPDIDALRDVIGDAPIDAIATTDEHRRKRLLVADMDSTVVTGETLDELADFAGLKAAAESQRAVVQDLQLRAARLL